MDRSTCATDDDELCVLVGLYEAPVGPAQRACLALLEPSKRSPFDRLGRTCFLYSGLTPDADATFGECIAEHRRPDACEPPLDWK